MSDRAVPLTVFTKPWKEISVAELGELISGMGFNGVELPVRPGYQVEPENVATDLPRVAKELLEFGVKIWSVAGPVDEPTIAACGEAGVPIIRICVNVDVSKGYRAMEEEMRSQFDEVMPLLAKHNVTIGIQNHCGNSVGSALGIMSLIDKYDPKHVAAVLDIAHCGLDGEPEEMAIDIAWSHLCMVNLKNAFRIRTTGPEQGDVKWRHYWTSGRQGFTSWTRTADELKRRDYKGPVCLTAEYSDHDSVERLIREDIAYATELFA